MSLQSKLIEAAADFRSRAAALGQTAFESTRRRARQAIEGSRQIPVSVSTLRAAGGEFRTVASRHLSRFVDQNSSLAREAGKDMLHLARSTYARLAPGAVSRAPRKAATRRKRAPTAGRSRRSAKMA